MARKASMRQYLAAWLLLPALLLTGCWDRIEIEDQGHVVAMGLDLGPGRRLMATLRIALVAGLSPSGRGAAPSTKPQGLASDLVTASGDTVTQTLYVLNAGSSRRLDFRHVRAVLVGEELARAGLEPVVMELLHGGMIRETAALIQTRGRAFDVLAAGRPVEEVNPAKLEEDYLLVGKHLHMTPPTRVHHFAMRLAALGGDPFLSLQGINAHVAAGQLEPTAEPPSSVAGEQPRGGGNPVGQSGTAIFRRDRLKGFISVDETQMLLAMRAEMGKAYVTFPDPLVPGSAVTMRFHQENRPKFQATFQSGRPRVEVRLLFEGELLAAPGGVDYTRPDRRRVLEQAAAAYAERKINELNDHLTEWGADPVEFGLRFRNQFPSWDAWQAYNWSRHVPDMQVQAHVDMRIRRYGLYNSGDRVNGGR